jgi:hypothetical protein
MEKLGLNKDRLRLAWVSAAEGAQFARVVQEMESGLRKLTPKQVQQDAEKLAQFLTKKSAHGRHQNLEAFSQGRSVRVLSMRPLHRLLSSQGGSPGFRSTGNHPQMSQSGP